MKNLKQKLKEMWHNGLDWAVVMIALMFFILTFFNACGVV